MFWPGIKLACVLLTLLAGKSGSSIVVVVVAATRDRESIQTARQPHHSDTLLSSSIEAQKSLESPNESSEQPQPSEPGWDYEPRVWTPDEPAVAPADDDLEVELSEILRENSAIKTNNDADDETKHAHEVPESSGANSTWRDRSYFWDARQRRHYGKLEVSRPRLQAGNQSTPSADDKCTQFRVDIRETVICDKRRCDKLDFEWPKHANQLVVIETTKQGMRFYRSEYAFGPPPPPPDKRHHIRASSKQRFATQPLRRNFSTNTNNTTRISPPIKFDLLAELFKPKPATNSPAPIVTSPSYIYSTTPMASTTTATSTTTAMETSAEEADSTEQATPTTSTKPEVPSPTTSAPLSDATTAAQPLTEPPEDTGQVTTTSVRDPAAWTAQDNNRTRLVTTFRVSSKRRMQRIIGFGGGLSDSTCRNIRSLSPNMARSLMEDYFGPRGLRYTIARLTMGSSDFSTTPYTNNDAAAAKPQVTTGGSEGGGGGGGGSDLDDPAKDFDDWLRRIKAMMLKQQQHQPGGGGGYDQGDDVEMKNFHLTEEDYEFKLPIARQAMATSQQPIKFFSSLWSPPIWMKNNSDIVHGFLKGDVYGPYYKALAELMLRWLEAYRRQGVEFWATTGLNEPVTGIKPFIFHNSLGITRQDYVTFMKLYLGPMLIQRGFNNLKLIALDDNKGYAPTWAKAVLSDSEVAKYVSGIGLHWYMNDEYENLNFLSKEFPDKFLLSTEACNGYLPFQVHTLPGDWDRGVAYFYDIIKLMHRNVAGWVDWNMALDLSGGPSWIKNNLDAPIIVNAERDEYYKSPMFYAIGHFSRFVEPDSFRLDHRLAYAKYDYPLEAAAFMTPRDQMVIVALNANKHKVPFRIIVDRQVIKVVDLKADSFSTIIFNWKK